MGKHIHLNEFGDMIFNEYFKYLDLIKDGIDEKIFSFFRDEERYFLNTEDTFHDAHLHRFTYEINKKYYENEDWKEYIIKLEFLHASWEKFFCLTYVNARIHSFPCELLYSDFSDKDVLYHELIFDSCKKEYQHIIYFDNDEFLSIFFRNFDFSEKKLSKPVY